MRKIKALIDLASGIPAGLMQCVREYRAICSAAERDVDYKKLTAQLRAQGKDQKEPT